MNIETLTGIIAGTYLLGIGLQTITQGNSLYKEAKKNYKALDEENITTAPKPSKKDAYITAAKLGLVFVTPSIGNKILNESISGRIETKLIKQQIEKLAWGKNYELRPKK